MSKFQCGCWDKITRWFHEGVPIDIHDTIEAAGCTIGHDTVNIYYLILRFLFAIYSTVIVIWAFYRMVIMQNAFWNFWTYMTHWGFILSTSYFWCVTYLHLQIYLNKPKNSDDFENYKSIDELKLRRLWEITLYTLDTGLGLAIFIILLYYGLLYDGGTLKPISYHTHGIIGAMLAIDWLTSTWQLTYRGALSSFLTAFAWTMLSVIFYLAGWRNEYDGGRYIYTPINWGESPLGSLGYASVVMIAVPVLHMLLVAIKNSIMKCWINSRSDKEKVFLIINTNTDENNNDDSKL